MTTELKRTLTKALFETHDNPLANNQRVLVIAGVTTLACVFSGSAAALASYAPPFTAQETCAAEVARWQHSKDTLTQLSHGADELARLMRENPNDVTVKAISPETRNTLERTNTTVKDVLAGKNPPTTPRDPALTDAATPQIGTRPLVQPDCSTDSPAQVQHKLSDVAFFSNSLKNVLSPLVHNMGVAEQKFFCTQGRNVRMSLLDDKNQQLARVDHLIRDIDATSNTLTQAKKLDHTRVEETFDEFSLDKAQTDAVASHLVQYTEKANEIKKTLDTLEQTPEINCSSRDTASDTYHHSVSQRDVINTAHNDITQLNEKLTADTATAHTLFDQAQSDLNQRQTTSNQIKQERILREQQEIATNRQAVLNASIPELEAMLGKNLLPKGVDKEFIRDTLDNKRAYEQELARQREQALLEQQRLLEQQQRERELREGYEEYLRQHGIDPRTGTVQPTQQQTQQPIQAAVP